MISVTELHREAMALADSAIEAAATGDHVASIEKFRRAFELEQKAAGLVSIEPTRSVLLRSAATLALDCGEQREAERLVALALSGNPPDEIADELRDLYEQVSFQRHLDLRGCTLSQSELQLSISGNAVGFGMAESDEFISRVQSAEKLIYRTAERKRKQPFRERGQTTKSIRENYALFMSAPRAASFAVTFKLGQPKAQLEFPEFDDSGEIINEVLTCLEIYEQMDEDRLRRQIEDETYFKNFVGLAQQLSPDGERVKTVGFTAINGGRERRIALRKSGSSLIVPSSSELTMPLEPEDKITLSGRLVFADSTKDQGMIKLVDSEGKQYKVSVPAGMMSDIVRPLWEDEIVVSGTRMRGVLQLETIRRA